MILTISGNITHKNSPRGAEFDLAMLMALKQTAIITETPWTEGLNEFQGPLISEVLALVGASGNTLNATALNGYKVVIPLEEVRKNKLLFALKKNNLLLRVRTRGPIWVILPWTDQPSLMNNLHYTRAIWQLRSIVIR
ncbi:MAG: hypothetical protein OFPII_38710 [Osedax symbiont Rs1]|nr:MAG: hypothetical protein OFPII_38710 [Osedax symbiont Rs1]